MYSGGTLINKPFVHKSYLQIQPKNYGIFVNYISYQASRSHHSNQRVWSAINEGHHKS